MNLLLEKIYNILMQIFQIVSDKVVVKEPDRPSPTYPQPSVVPVKGVKFNTHGFYRTKTGYAKGLVVHYTVSGRTPENAVGVLKYLAKQGLGCMVMDEDGTIYVAENFDFEKHVAWHAGTSTWKGLTGMSQYCMGMEICCWGRLTPESKKRAKTMRRSGGSENIVAGEYEPYTVEQEEALIAFILWYAKKNPEFDVEYLIGHDECAKGRKSDPGASLSMSMPTLRTLIKKRLAEL